MPLNPFDIRPAKVARWARRGDMVEVLILVPIGDTSAVMPRVMVPRGDQGCADWARRAETAGLVTAVAVRARLLAREGDPE